MSTNLTGSPIMLSGLERYILAVGEDFVPPSGFVPFAKGSGLVHIFYDLPPTDAGVVCAERNFPFFGSVRNNTHLSAPEIIVP